MKEKRRKTNKQSIQELPGNFKRYGIYIIGKLEKEERRKQVK